MTAWVLLCSMIGCTTPAIRDAGPLLHQPRMSSDSLVLDVFLLRVPLGDPEMNGPAWREIDEQPFPADSRRHWLANGFRAGVLAGQLPAELARRLEVADNQALPGEITELAVDRLAEPPAVLRGHFQLRAGARKEFSIGPTRDKLDVLVVDPDGGLSGKSYDGAQLLFAATAHPLNDGRVQLALVPEIVHGNYTQRWEADGQGVLRLNPGRKSRVFEDMKVEAVLAPGHMLVMSAVPSRTGSLGSQFFTEPSGKQILLLMRLSQTQHDGQFASPAEPAARQADLVVK